MNLTVNLVLSASIILALALALWRRRIQVAFVVDLDPDPSTLPVRRLTMGLPIIGDLAGRGVGDGRTSSSCRQGGEPTTRLGR